MLALSREMAVLGLLRCHCFLICFCCSPFDSVLIFNSQESWERVKVTEIQLKRLLTHSPAMSWEPWGRAVRTAQIHEKSTFKWCTHEKDHSLCWSSASLKTLNDKTSYDFSTWAGPPLFMFSPNSCSTSSDLRIPLINTNIQNLTRQGVFLC